MAQLNIKTQGVRGGSPQYKENIAAAALILGHSEDKIVVDVFDGQGPTYKRRETELINITQNGNLLFYGDKYELFEILKKNKQQ